MPINQVRRNLQKQLRAREEELQRLKDCKEYMRNNFDATLIRVERPYFDNGLTDTQKNHPSEVAMDNYTFDYIIENKWDMGILKNKVKTFVDQVLIDDN